jgi:hypothetical protein
MLRRAYSVKLSAAAAALSLSLAVLAGCGDGPVGAGSAPGGNAPASPDVLGMAEGFGMGGGSGGGIVLGSGEAWKYKDGSGEAGYIFTPFGGVQIISRYNSTGNWEMQDQGTYRLEGKNRITIDWRLQGKASGTYYVSTDAAPSLKLMFDGNRVALTKTDGVKVSIPPFDPTGLENGGSNINFNINIGPNPGLRGGNLVCGRGEIWAYDWNLFEWAINMALDAIPDEEAVVKDMIRQIFKPWFEEFWIAGFAYLADGSLKMVVHFPPRLFDDWDVWVAVPIDGAWSTSGSKLTGGWLGMPVPTWYGVSGNEITLSGSGQSVTLTKIYVGYIEWEDYLRLRSSRDNDSDYY